jgi:cell division protease FtsH
MSRRSKLDPNISLNEILSSESVSLKKKTVAKKAPIDTKEIKRKLAKLEEVKAHLKKDFVGIDKQIEQIVESLKVWYIFPETLSKPLIINLWGITGTFKTSIIRRLVTLLGVSSFKEIDSRKVPNDTLRNIIGVGRHIDDPSLVLPEVFLLDEFQNIRTISNRGDDTEAANELYELFSWLSDGKIKYTRSAYIHSKLTNLVTNITISPENIIKEVSNRRKNLRDYNIDGTESPTTMSDAEIFYDIYYYTFEEYFVFSKEAIIVFQNDLQAMFKFIVKTAPALSLDYTLDLSKGLVFIAGNVDEAFAGLTHNMDNDMLTPDQFYEVSSQVNFNVIKESLLYRFKPEQVARLGTNHVIFPSFNTKMYRKFIHSLNKRTLAKFKRFPVKITIDETVTEFILTHAAIPSQGARSVLSAHEYLVDSNIPEALASSLLSGGNAVTISIKKEDVLITTKKKTIKKEITIIDKVVLENYTSEALNATISIHEAAHGICGIALLGVLPDMIKTRLSNGEIGGYCKFPDDKEMSDRESYINYIALCMGGYAGEFMRKGFNNISVGCSSDILTATSLAASMVKVLGLGSHLSASGFSMSRDSLVTHNKEMISEEVDDLIGEGLFLAFVCLDFYNEEHKALTKILMNQPTTRPKDIKHLF